MKARPIFLYVAAVAGTAGGILTAVSWDVFLSIPTRHVLWGFGLLAVLGVLSEATALSHRIARESGNSSLVFLPLVVCVILFGPVAALLFIGLTAAVVEVLIRRKEVIRCVFNTSQYIVATACAGAAFALAGGRPLVFDMAASTGFQVVDQLFPILLFGVVLFFCNHLFVGAAIALAHAEPLAHVLSRTFGRSGLAFVHDLLVLPLAVPIAWLYFELQWVGLITALVPLMLVRYAYLSLHRLQVANTDLLKALVKAIEIRDPYTSGHSLRVQRLAQTIGQRLGLSERRLADLSAAALLHDIGKIELTYESIIKKPSALTEEEWRIIRSHVTRGAEILRSLASVGPRIIEGVRHHHERYDGSGYPDGIAGADIPLEARIINLCDAIDAMLSDRSYRQALQEPAVEEELRRFAGTQFDPYLVDVVLRHRLVSFHKKTMQLERSVGPPDVMHANVSEVLVAGHSL